MTSKLKATEEQLAYADLLDKGMKIGLLLLVVTFVIYLTAVMKPHIPRYEISKYWGMKVSDYLYVVSQKEHGNVDEALALISACKTADPASRPAECSSIAEKGHHYAGWKWLGMLGKGDFLNFLGIAFLSGVTILCYIRIVPILFRKGDTIYAILAILEVLVLVLAASGLLKSGGH